MNGFSDGSSTLPSSTNEQPQLCIKVAVVFFLRYNAENFRASVSAGRRNMALKDKLGLTSSFDLACKECIARKKLKAYEQGC